MIYPNIMLRGQISAAVAAYHNESNEVERVGLLVEHTIVSRYISELSISEGACIITVDGEHLDKAFYLKLGGWVRARGDVVVDWQDGLPVVELVNLEELVVL